MTALEEIKKALEILNQPKSMSMYASQGDMISDLLKDRRLASSTLESLQRDNEELRKGMQTTSKRLRGANAAFERERKHHLENQELNRKLEARAEAAEAEVKRLQAEIDRKSSMPGDHRYWEGRYRDEAAENDRLRGILFKCGSFIADRYQEGDSEYQVVLLVNDAICSKPALASTGGEHHAE